MGSSPAPNKSKQTIVHSIVLLLEAGTSSASDGPPLTVESSHACKKSKIEVSPQTIVHWIVLLLETGTSSASDGQPLIVESSPAFNVPLPDGNGPLRPVSPPLTRDERPRT